jgi:hypothetical protein
MHAFPEAETPPDLPDPKVMAGIALGILIIYVLYQLFK